MNNEFYSGKKVLVTGSGGFVGSALVARLKAEGASVWPFDRKRGDDVRQPLDVFGAFGTHCPDVVFHLAAQTEVLASYLQPYLTYATNVTGTLNVLEACRAYGVKSVVVASSDKAYGAICPPFREADVPLSNADPYSSSKRLAEEVCRDYKRLFDLPVLVTRCCNLYGPGQANETTLITSVANKLLRGELAEIHGGHGHTVREWLFVDDAVEAYLLLGAEDSRGCPPGHIFYNVSSGDVHSVSSVVHALSELICPGRNPCAFVSKSPGPAQTAVQHLDSSKFRKKFPWWNTTPFAEGLTKTVDWYRNHT